MLVYWQPITWRLEYSNSRKTVTNIPWTKSNILI